MTPVRRAASQFLIAVSVAVGGCAGPAPVVYPAPDSVPNLQPEEVESVLFFVGDPGESYLSTSPVLMRLQQDIEWWSANLEADSSVAMLVLGDIRYPIGVHPEDHRQFPEDTAVVMSQVRLLAGPAASSRGARGYFMAGNHDWGLREDFEGFVRLLNLQRLLDRGRAELGSDVHLVPEAGTGGPYVVDWGEHLRLLLLDTAWWLLLATDETRAEAIADIDEAMRTAGSRELLLAGHHPFKSGGSHGGGFSFWEALGFRFLLHRSGAILQDLTSIPYREFEQGLRGVFGRHGAPLFFVGGHDHSLQVLAGTEPTDPHFNIVSGSVSKLSGVGEREGLVFGATLPGYMRLVIAKDGGMTLFVEATPTEFQHCPTVDPARVECMASGLAEFRTVYWREVR